ncbi:MAG TPA: AraC family transcriptional regulator [Bacteroidia bacterium]
MPKIPIKHITTGAFEAGYSGVFSIREISGLINDNDMVQALHGHSHYLVLVLDKAKGSHVIDFVPYELNRHSVFIMRPGQVHSLTLESGSSGYLMQFSAEFYYPLNKESHRLLRRASNKNLCCVNDDRFNRLLNVLKQMQIEFNERQEGYLEVIKSSLSIFFIELLRNRKNESETEGHQLYAHERLEEFMEHLEKHVYKHKQVSEYAEMMNLSTYQLNAIIKSTIGKTCSEAINAQIMLESKRRLLAGSDQISTIADDLGYEDVSYFIRFFKKQTGYTPEAYRKHFA